MAPADSASGTGDRSVSLTTCNGTDASLPAMQLRARRRSATNLSRARRKGNGEKGLEVGSVGVDGGSPSSREQIAAKGLARGQRTTGCHRCTLGARALCTRHCARERANNTADAWLCPATSPPISRKNGERARYALGDREMEIGLSATTERCDLLIISMIF
jgi:hypothetical protein